MGMHSSMYNTQLGNYNCIGDSVVVTNSSLGDYTYINGHSLVSNASIGKFCSIANDVQISLGIHPIDQVSTHPAFYSNNKPFVTFADKNYVEESKQVHIGHDVWIGARVMILDGVTIGDGAIIAAGAVVTKNIEPYAIVGGVPAKLIKYRLDKETIEKLKNIQWWNRNHEYYKKNFRLFQKVEDFFHATLE